MHKKSTGIFVLVILWQIGCVDSSYNAAKRGDLPALKHSLSSHNDIDEFNSKGINLLSIAAYHGNGSVVRYLLELGANPNARNARGHTPLFFAARGGDLTATSILLDNGAELDHKDVDGETAVWHATRENRTTVVKHLISKGALLETVSGWSIIDLAVGNGNTDLVSIFIDIGQDVNSRDPFYGQTLLHLAVNQGRPNMVKLLLDSGADATARNKAGETPLEHARSLRTRSERVEAILLRFQEDNRLEPIQTS